MLVSGWNKMFALTIFNSLHHLLDRVCINFATVKNAKQNFKKKSNK